MTLDNDGFVKTATRPVNLQKMPGNVAVSPERVVLCVFVLARRLLRLKTQPRATSEEELEQLVYFAI